MLRPVRLVRLYCIFPKDIAKLVADILQNLGLVHLYDIKEEHKSLNPIEIKYDDELREITERTRKCIKEIKTKAGKNLFEWLIGPRYSVVEKSDIKMSDITREAERLLHEIKQKYGEINGKNAMEIKRHYYFKLLAINEHLENLKAKANAIKKFGATKYTTSFGGFTTKENILKVINALDTKTSGKCAFEFKDATPKDKPPTLLLNPKLIKPFEILTENYGIPSYSGIDPTPILAVTFTLLFGLMFPDVGYGVMLVFISSLVYFITRKTTKFIRNLNIILIYGGASSIFFGFMFGEFFGEFITLKSFLFDPARDVITILLISILIGLVHISIALISTVITEKNKLHHLSLLTSLWSIVFFAYTRNINFLILFAAAIVALIYENGFYIIEEVVSLFTHVLSYLRVGVLSILSIVVSRLLVDTVSGLPRDFTGIALGALLMVSGVLFSFLTGVVSVFIQSLRLHWLEFFSSYKFTGKKFEPFSYRKEYLYVI